MLTKLALMLIFVGIFLFGFLFNPTVPSAGAEISWMPREQISTQQVGGYSQGQAFMIDGGGTLHAIWRWYPRGFESTENGHYYAQKHPGQPWSTPEFIPGIPGSLPAPELEAVVDPDGTVHAIVHTNGTRQAFYLKRIPHEGYCLPAICWSSERIPSPGDVDAGVSIARGPDGTLHFAYVGPPGYAQPVKPFYLSRTNGIWSIVEQIGSGTGGPETTVKISVDSAGVVHAAWSEGTQESGYQRPFYSTRLNGTWTPAEQLADITTTILSPPIVDSDSTTHFAILQQSSYNPEHVSYVYYVSRTNSGQLSEPVQLVSHYAPDSFAFVLGSNDVLHTAFATDPLLMYYKTKSPGAPWETASLLSATPPKDGFGTPLIALGGGGAVHIIFSGIDGQMHYITNNLPPSVGQISVSENPVQVNTNLNASTSFTDSNTEDTHTAVWDWGDGNTSSGNVTETNGSGTVTGSHPYTTPGVYTLNLAVTDNNSGLGNAPPFQYVVVYDPNGGFVTGAGSIESPAGAYTPQPSLTGKAIFGFVSKYQPGKQVPTGNTQFRFQVANLVFQSTSYDWLVVAGARAQFKGTGTIAGETGTFGFILTAIDSEINGGGNQDKFRIKIWDKSQSNDGSSGVIYDNKLNAPDTSDPSTVLSSGNIKIQH